MTLRKSEKRGGDKVDVWDERGDLDGETTCDERRRVKMNRRTPGTNEV